MCACVRACVRKTMSLRALDLFVTKSSHAILAGDVTQTMDSLSFGTTMAPPPTPTHARGTPLEVGCTNNCLRFTYPSTCANAWIISPQSPLLACHVNLPFRFLQFLVWQLQGFQVKIFRTSSKGWFSPLESIFPFPPLGRSGFAWCRGYSSCH